MSQDQTEKVFNYIAALEDVNEQLVKSLEKCVKLLAQFHDSVPDPEGWQTMLDNFDEIIRVGEKTIEEKTCIDRSIRWQKSCLLPSLPKRNGSIGPREL